MVDGKFMRNLLPDDKSIGRPTSAHEAQSTGKQQARTGRASRNNQFQLLDQAESIQHKTMPHQALRLANKPPISIALEPSHNKETPANSVKAGTNLK